VAQAAGCEVIRLPGHRGISAARNAGGRRAAGDVLAFIDADTTVEPGWATALCEAFDEGAALAGGAVGWPPPRSLLETFQFRARWHDEDGRNGLLPFVSGVHFVIRRELFLTLDGFDELLPAAEDVDLSFRAQLRGYPVSFVSGARLLHWPRPTVTALLAQRMHHREGKRFAHYKYRQFPFFHPELRPGYPVAALAGTWRRLRATGRTLQPRLWGLAALDIATAWAAWLGAVRADVQLMTGLEPLPAQLAPDPPEQRAIASPLPSGPACLIVGDRLLVTKLQAGLIGGGAMSIAPYGLEGEALARWEEPAPWSLRLARMAARAGWTLDVGTVAQRLERERPVTWGDAFLTLHRVHAWARARQSFALLAPDDGGWGLCERLPGVPVVVAGEERRGDVDAAVQVTKDDLVHHRDETFRRLRAGLA